MKISELNSILEARKETEDPVMQQRLSSYMEEMTDAFLSTPINYDDKPLFEPH